MIVQEGGAERDLVVGVVRAKHDVHKAAGEVRKTVGYYACNGQIVHFGASGKKNSEEGNVISTCNANLTLDAVMECYTCHMMQFA